MEDKTFIDRLLHAHADEMVLFMESQTATQFVESPNGKWSAGQNLDHLNKSLSPVNLALRLPGFVLSVMFGKPNRKPRTYDELVERYHQKLAAGGKASAQFIPPHINAGQKEKLLIRFRKEIKFMSKRMSHWSEEQLDNYLLPHPLLGKLTLREMLFFSAYHIHHHHKLLQERKVNI
jgi:DinB superfamily